MEILQDVVNNLGCQLVNLQIDKLNARDYAIQTCNENTFKTESNIELELLFLKNIDYLNLTDEEKIKIKNGNYKGILLNTTCK